LQLILPIIPPTRSKSGHPEGWPARTESFREHSQHESGPNTPPPRSRKRIKSNSARRPDNLRGRNYKVNVTGYWIELAALEKTVLAFEPINRTVPTTNTRMTANITAYSAISWPESSLDSSRKSPSNWEGITVAPCTHQKRAEYTRIPKLGKRFTTSPTEFVIEAKILGKELLGVFSISN
jgi:hypothetical protein